ncbi:MAG: peptide MFS transporter [Bacteroidales bacterium]|nr:peptide MFS transporter [Bacteroidales bacterium]
MALFGNHPKGLSTLFFSEMWERFCYYGMRTLLTLYLVKSLLKGDSQAALIYGAYTGLVYAAPILGGRMADKFLGYRFAVILGGILMAIGEFTILMGTENSLLIGMGALIIGNGYFKANISTIVGKLYTDNDDRRDSGFTIFYIGINVGALLATTVVAYIGETYGFEKGFGLAGLGMLAGISIFWSGRKNYSVAPGVDLPEEGKKKILGFRMAHIIMVASLLLIPLLYLLILNNSVLNWIFLGLFIIVAYSLVSAGIKEDIREGTKIWKDRMIALIMFMLINIVFWACFEQAGTSLTLFADRNVDRSIFDWTMPASMTQFFNPFFIIVFGSLFSMMWIRLSKINRNPNIPMKFSFGIFQLGLGFLITYIGYQFAENSLVPMLTLVFLYMLHTTGELFLSPIGLSMVTKLSPKKMAGTAMGAWFLSFAIANFLGGKIATLTGAEGEVTEYDKSEFTIKTTVEEAFEMDGRTADFEKWKPLHEGEPEGNDISQNISYEKYLDILDWVILRESLDSNQTMNVWLSKRQAGLDTFKNVKEWLQREDWNDLGARYKAIAIADNKAKDNAGISMEDWNYFRGGIEKLEHSDSLLLESGLEMQKSKVQAAQLDKYVDVFTKIGLILLVFALIIAATSNPLKKLMHGIK